MPGEQPLTDEQKEVATRYLTEVWTNPNKACPISGHNNWSIADHLIQPQTVQITDGGTGLRLGGAGVGYPYLQVVCAGCGYAFFVSAVMAGVTPRTSSREGVEVPYGATANS